MTMTHDVCLRHRMLPRETTMCKQSMQSVICTWLSLQTDYAIRPSWIPFCRGVNNCRNSPAKSGWLIGCAPGHQVTPRPLHAFPRMGVKWLLTFVRRGIKDPSPSCIFLCRGMRWLLAPQGSHIALNEWVKGVLCRVSSTRGSLWRGAGIIWMRECPLHTADISSAWVSSPESLRSTTDRGQTDSSLKKWVNRTSESLEGKEFLCNVSWKLEREQCVTYSKPYHRHNQ